MKDEQQPARWSTLPSSDALPALQGISVRSMLLPYAAPSIKARLSQLVSVGIYAVPRCISAMSVQQEYPVSKLQEKRLNRIAEHKGFRLDKAGKGTAQGRFYIMNLSEGGRMRSGVLDHEYSFSPEEAETWLDTHA
jgi:hypothetical protein